MSLRISLVCITLLITLAIGCKKDDDTIYHGKVQNTLSQPVHLDFYSSLNDYMQNKNVVSSVTIPANGESLIPAEFEGGSKYYLDWYSDDFLNTNWGSDASFNVPNITPEMDPALSIQQRFSYIRRIFINGNQPSVRWKAIDAKSGSFSMWSTLTANEKFREIVINKDLTGTYSYKDAFGITQKMDFRFSTNSGSSSPTNIFLFFSGTPSSGYSLSAASSGSSSIVLDTIMNQSFLPPDNSSFYTYYFTRQ